MHSTDVNTLSLPVSHKQCPENHILTPIFQVESEKCLRFQMHKTQTARHRERKRHDDVERARIQSITFFEILQHFQLFNGKVIIKKIFSVTYFRDNKKFDYNTIIYSYRNFHE